MVCELYLTKKKKKRIENKQRYHILHFLCLLKKLAAPKASSL